MSELSNFGIRKALTPVREFDVNAIEFRTLKFTPDANYSTNKLFKVNVGDFTLKCTESVMDAIATNDVAVVGLFEFENDKKELVKYARITGVK
jgi:predicted extracellular nuclease